MEKIKFKGKQFKGSEGEFLLKPNSNGGVILDTQSGQPIQVLNKFDANLFANSKNLLKAAIEVVEFMQYFNNNSRKVETAEFWSEFVDVKTRLENEILKSL